eukprot:13329787-Alexandrium_andersonii.AAC.1
MRSMSRASNCLPMPPSCSSAVATIGDCSAMPHQAHQPNARNRHCTLRAMRCDTALARPRARAYLRVAWRMLRREPGARLEGGMRAKVLHAGPRPSLA